MDGHVSIRVLQAALLVLRSLGIFLLQWGVEKFVVPSNTTAIWGYFYGLKCRRRWDTCSARRRIAIAACLIFGAFRTIAYGAAMVAACGYRGGRVFGVS